MYNSFLESHILYVHTFLWGKTNFVCIFCGLEGYLRTVQSRKYLYKFAKCKNGWRTLPTRPFAPLLLLYWIDVKMWTTFRCISVSYECYLLSGEPCCSYFTLLLSRRMMWWPSASWKGWSCFHWRVYSSSLPEMPNRYRCITVYIHCEYLLHDEAIHHRRKVASILYIDRSMTDAGALGS